MLVLNHNAYLTFSEFLQLLSLLNRSSSILRWHAHFIMLLILKLHNIQILYINFSHRKMPSNLHTWMLCIFALKQGLQFKIGLLIVKHLYQVSFELSKINIHGGIHFFVWLLRFEIFFYWKPCDSWLQINFNKFQ
jgi:hypothetical protein